MPLIRNIDLVPGPASELDDPTPPIDAPGSLVPLVSSLHSFSVSEASAQRSELSQLDSALSSELRAIDTPTNRLSDATQAIRDGDLQTEIDTLIARETARRAVDNKVTDLIEADPRKFTGPPVFFTATNLEAQKRPFDDGLAEWNSAFPLWTIGIF